MPISVYHSYGKWYLSGVNTWSVNLIRAMRDTEFDSKVLFTGIPRSPQPELDDLNIPYDFLDVPDPRKRHLEWRALKEYLESRAPCIYITNYDFHRSCAVGTLDPSVRVITVIHSDEECYYDELRRIGQNCDSIVCVSSFLTSKVKKRFPQLADRVHFIPHGIPISEVAETARPATGPLRLCYCNRLQQYQKHVFDLPLIAAELEKRGVDYELDIAGYGPDADELRKRFAAACLNSPVRFHGRITNAAVMDLYRRSHIFLLTSDFEGLPISLLEAMSVGCVPVVYQIESGIADAISSDDYGRQIPHGDTGDFAATVMELGENRRMLARISEQAMQRVCMKFSLSRMEKDYVKLFSKIVDSELATPLFRSGSTKLPRDLTLSCRALRKLHDCFSLKWQG